MNELPSREAVTDKVQAKLAAYAHDFAYDKLPAQVVHAAKVRTIDVLGALIGGFFGESCRITRDVAAKVPSAGGATILGTRLKTTPDLAAFVNASTARYPEMTDSYHWPGSSHGHASETVMPVFAAAEVAGASGRDLIASIVLSYEICLRIADAFHGAGFDACNFSCVANAAAAGKILGLSRTQLAHAISMTAVSNVMLKQVRTDRLSMFKAVASGQAGRAGVFAALMARAGVEGPHLPFEGKSGWITHVARKPFALADMGGENGAGYKILDTQIKIRPSNGSALACILAAEKIAPLRDIDQVQEIIVETYRYALDAIGSGEHHWHPHNREDADHSAPYLVAATLLDGTLTLRSYDEAHLGNPKLRALIQKTKVVENPEFTQAFERFPVEHRTRITVVTSAGRLTGETGADADDLSWPKSDAQIERKFLGVAEDILGSVRAKSLLDRIWHLEELRSVEEIPPMLAGAGMHKN